MNKKIADRFDRQMRFPPIGREGQEKLLRARVVQAGAGGLGGTVALCLGRVGLKQLTIIDKDRVEISNLPRQFLFDEIDLKHNARKACTAARKIARGDSRLKVISHNATLSAKNADQLLGGHGLVIDALDNMETRWLVNDWCVKNRVPLVHAGVAGATGLILSILPGKGPCLRCLFPDPEAGRLAPTTGSAGIVNTVPAVFGALEATEAVKILLGDKNVITDPRVFDLWTGEYTRLKVKRNPRCVCCGQRKFEFLEK